MNTTRTKILVTTLLAIVAGALSVQIVLKPVFVTWLRAHSTVRTLLSPSGCRYSIAVYRYPTLRGSVECLGFGQGYVQLFDSESGKVLEEKLADDLVQIRSFAWGATSVTIDGFAEWRLPEWRQARY